MPSEKSTVRRKFNGRSYRVSNLKEGPKKKRLVGLLMKARRDVRDSKNKREERRARNRVHKYKKQLGER